MSKSVMRSAKPYWIYLILTGKKKIEVGKNFPKAEDWNRIVEMYCSKDMRSFNRIPEEDRGWMCKYLGKVACRFVCDRIDTYVYDEHMGYPTPAFDGDDSFCDCGEGYWIALDELIETCLTYDELLAYGKGKRLYGWHISDLVVYDMPKELGEFKIPCDNANKCCTCKHGIWEVDYIHGECGRFVGCEYEKGLIRPPMSWGYCEEVCDAKNTKV